MPDSIRIVMPDLIRHLYYFTLVPMKRIGVEIWIKDRDIAPNN